MKQRKFGIDSHQHFWNFDPVRESWITDEMSVIRKDFLPRHLEPLLKENGLQGCVAVQSDQSEEHNNFLLGLAEESNIIKGIVGWVDLRAENIEERLGHYKQYKIIKGFRHVLQGEEDRSLMLRPEFMRGISALKEFNYTYDILIFPDQLQYIPEFVSAFPDQKFVIDHLAKPYIKDKKIEEWKRDIQALSKYENVFCKISGMVTEADYKTWKKEDFTPYIEVVAEAFGINRIMYGSDWPVCLAAGSYAQVIGIVEDYFAQLSADEQQLVFGGNAAEFYGL
jgi:L-fuconolactonase